MYHISEPMGSSVWSSINYSSTRVMFTFQYNHITHAGRLDGEHLSMKRLGDGSIPGRSQPMT
jgi:hypothetical protein